MSEAPTDKYRQHIPLDGTPNFRDLGGRSNVHGQVIKRRKLFRSGFLSDLSESDWNTFNQLNITRICDFRRSDELQRNPTVPPFQVEINHLPIGDGSHHALIRQTFEAEDITQEEVRTFMRDINRELAFEHAETYKKYFSQLLELNAGESLLFHCSAGKDRTGFAAALTLMAVDVDRDNVLEDYMLSLRFFNPDRELERIRAMLPKERYKDTDPELLRPILATDIEYIKTALDMVHEAGGFQQYANDFLGLNHIALAELKKLLLE